MSQSSPNAAAQKPGKGKARPSSKKTHELKSGHRPPSVPGASTDPDTAAIQETNQGVDRGAILEQMFAGAARWSWRFLLVIAALVVFFYIVGQLWVGIFPVVLGIILSTVLWPAVRWLDSKGWPSALGTLVTMLVFIGGIVGILAAIAPALVGQVSEVIDNSASGIEQVQDWLAGPPLNIQNEQLNEASAQVVEWLQSSAGGIATGVITGVSAVSSGVLTFVLTLALTFFFLKDGKGFLPWIRRISGRRIGSHLTEVLSRIYTTVAGFIRTQALVGLIDAVMIGIGLWILGVPLVFALMVLTFFGAFIPIVGALIAGGFAVLVALVTQGFTAALITLIIVLVVQQVEGNLLLPVLQSKSMDLHAGIVLIGVTAGGTLFGIAGAFLAVPVAATIAVILRYISEQVDLQTGDLSAEELSVLTPHGRAVAKAEEAEAERSRHGTDRQIAEGGNETTLVFTESPRQSIIARMLGK